MDYCDVGRRVVIEGDATASRVFSQEAGHQSQRSQECLVKRTRKFDIRMKVGGQELLGDYHLGISQSH